MRKVMLVVAMAAAVSGCASNQKWVRAGATSADFDADKLRCQYEAEVATPGGYAGPGIGNAVASGIDSGLRKLNLQQMCMQTKGWSLQAG